MTRIRLQICFDGEPHKLGPGKIRLLEAIREHGSISAAARSMKMAYRHAWEMMDDLNRCFGGGVLETAPGGAAGGGARLTAFGEALVDRYHHMEAVTRKAVGPDLAALDARRTAPSRRRAARRP